MNSNFARMIKKSGLKKNELAAKMGITPETFSRHFNGHTSLTTKQACAYAEILKCDPRDILFELHNFPIFRVWENSTASEKKRL